MLALLAFCCGSAHAQIELPKVIGDNMVLQQGEPAAIWGSGIPGRKVSVRFLNESGLTTFSSLL